MTMKRRALVTGAAGFVGRHMAAALDAAGWTVTGLDLRADPLRSWSGSFAVGDCRGLRRDSPLDFDLVVHCAAVVGGRTMIDGSPLVLAAEDLSIDSLLFRWLDHRSRSRGRRPHVVYFSSSAAYPVELQHRPSSAARAEMASSLALHESDINLNNPGLPDQTYGWVKLTGERLAAEAAADGLPVHVFRPFSGYGSDQALDYPFPSFIARAAKRDDPFEVWGDGGQVRDFVHIDDVVGCVMAALDQDVRGPVNIGTGVDTSFDELAALCMASAGYDAPIQHHVDAPVGVQYRVADTTLMRSFYEPLVSLAEGVERALNDL